MTTRGPRKYNLWSALNGLCSGRGPQFDNREFDVHEVYEDDIGVQMSSSTYLLLQQNPFAKSLVHLPPPRCMQTKSERSVNVICGVSSIRGNCDAGTMMNTVGSVQISNSAEPNADARPVSSTNCPEILHTKRTFGVLQRSSPISSPPSSPA